MVKSYHFVIGNTSFYGIIQTLPGHDTRGYPRCSFCGFPLFVYAWQYRYRIISSVWDYEARVVDITGRALAQTTRWARLAIADLDLDKRLFHVDGQYEQILQIRSAYGNRVSVETLNEEHMFALTSCDSSVSLDEMVKQQLSGHSSWQCATVWYGFTR
jgi:hypothetical protein